MSRNHYDGTRESLLHAGETVQRRFSTAWEGFQDFVFRDNVLEVAAGLIIASAFTAVVKSLVSDILTPILGLIPFINRNLDEKFAVLRKGPDYCHGPHGDYTQRHCGYNTLQQARDDGAVVLAYGSFINQILSFFFIGLSLYTIAQVYGWASSDSIVKHTVKCKYCHKRISEKAKRCVNCTSWQDGREEVRS